MDQKWISLAEAARYTNLSIVTMRRMVRQGRVRAVRINGARVWRTTRAWVDEGLAGGAVPAGAAAAGAEGRDE